MIVGKVNSEEEPEVYLTLMIHQQKVRKRAIVDTGFNGYLSVPLFLVKDWNFFGYEKYEIATGEIVEEKVYLGKIVWDQKLMDVYAVTSHSKDILIGTKLLRNKKLLIDFREKKVSIK